MAKFCGNCGKQSHDEANMCGYCGYQFPQAAAQQPAYQGNSYQQQNYQQPVYQQQAYQQPAYQQQTYQQPAYQQQSYQQPAYQPTYPNNPIGGQGSINPAFNKQGFFKSRIFLLIATLLQIYATIVYFVETIVIKQDGDTELSESFFSYMESEGGEFLVFIPLVVGIIALILNVLSICFKKFGRAIKQIPQMIIAFLNLGFYGFLVFAVRDELNYGEEFKEYLEAIDATYSDGLGMMVFVTIAIFALMITAAVFQKKEKNAEKAAVIGY